MKNTNLVFSLKPSMEARKMPLLSSEALESLSRESQVVGPNWFENSKEDLRNAKRPHDPRVPFSVDHLECSVTRTL